MSRSWTYRALSSLAFAAFSTAAFALPTNLYFDNQTDITLDAYTAGQPGASIQANSSNFSVPYIGVMIRCNNGGVPRACPIDFYDKAAGKKQLLLY